MDGLIAFCNQTELNHIQNSYTSTFSYCLNIAFQGMISDKMFVLQIVGQIKEAEENIARLKKAIDDKVLPMQLAQTRLDTRTNRPNVELCRDPVQYRLIEEVGEIESSVAQLQARLKQTEDSLKGLIRNQLALEEDIGVKANTLFIDEVECMGMRKSINIQNF